MTINAKVICHSVSALGGPPLVTVKARYPKFIHGELMTHRVFSRNASSSRAIPVARLIQDVLDDPAVPIHWGMNEKGMQASKECNALVSEYFGPFGNWEDLSRDDAWLAARDYAVRIARAFSHSDYHKQIVNRLLEPFCHITTLISSTQWSNFFALRCHPAAQPEMRELATQIRTAIEQSEPTMLAPGEWHLPFVTEDDFADADMMARHGSYVWPNPDDPRTSDQVATNFLIKLSVARCARVSYETHEGKVPTIEKDLELYEKLLKREEPDDPIHASPAEHQATPHTVFDSTWNDKCGNFDSHWRQFRKQLTNECL